MRKLIYGVLALALVASGCAITDYPVISDDRADYSGVIRTGHKAYIMGTSSVATIWDDGSDELFTMVYQNEYGDQKLYTFNNFDPTAAVLFVDQTYCDWRYQGCELARATNPQNPLIDDPFDYEAFPDCSGFRSLSMLASQSTRLGECGDQLFLGNKEDLIAEFANLATTNWRGETAYLIPLNAETTTFAVNGNMAPIYGQLTTFMTNKLQLVVPMTPNSRYELNWLREFASQNETATLTVTFGSASATMKVAFVPQGLDYNLNRY